MMSDESEAEVITYAVGLCAASVCTNGTLENALRVVDDRHPTGLDHGWTPSTQVFRDHDSNTMPCAQNPDTHTHYLLEC